MAKYMQAMLDGDSVEVTRYVPFSEVGEDDYSSYIHNREDRHRMYGETRLRRMLDDPLSNRDWIWTVVMAALEMRAEVLDVAHAPLDADAKRAEEATESFMKLLWSFDDEAASDEARMAKAYDYEKD
jgi:hypothetical protein